jgi:hypothetical protein
MPTALYESGPNGFWVFLLVTIILGGVTAFVSGKAVAETWRPYWQIFAYMALLAATVRFLHFALFEETLLSARSFVVDYLVVTAAALLGHKIARGRQMATQYHWTQKT